MTSSSPLVAEATIPVPNGWRFVLQDHMPSIQRDLGAFTLTVGLDDSGWWWWWVGPRSRSHSGAAVYSGSGEDMVDAIWQVFDALARHLDRKCAAADQQQETP